MLLDWIAIAAVAQIIQALIVVITLIYVSKQTSLARKSLQDLDKQTRIGVATNRNLHLVQINEILIRDESLAKDFEYEKKELVALLYLDNFEMRWYARREGATDKAGWEAEEKFIARTVKKRPAIQKVWEEYKEEFHPEFVDYLDQVIQRVMPKSSPESQRDGA